MPDMNLYEQRTTSKIEESMDEQWNRLEEKLMVWDQRMLSIRNDFDMGLLNKTLEKKA